MVKQEAEPAIITVLVFTVPMIRVCFAAMWFVALVVDLPLPIPMKVPSAELSRHRALPMHANAIFPVLLALIFTPHDHKADELRGGLGVFWWVSGT